MKKPATRAGFKINEADRTGLEPATSAVTGRHSNQLNYRSLAFPLEKQDLNPFLGGQR